MKNKVRLFVCTSKRSYHFLLLVWIGYPLHITVLEPQYIGSQWSSSGGRDIE